MDVSLVDNVANESGVIRSFKVALKLAVVPRIPGDLVRKSDTGSLEVLGTTETSVLIHDERVSSSENMVTHIKEGIVRSAGRSAASFDVVVVVVASKTNSSIEAENISAEVVVASTAGPMSFAIEMVVKTCETLGEGRFSTEVGKRICSEMLLVSNVVLETFIVIEDRSTNDETADLILISAVIGRFIEVGCETPVGEAVIENVSISPMSLV